jgi:hypothetical protein
MEDGVSGIVALFCSRTAERGRDRSGDSEIVWDQSNKRATGSMQRLEAEYDVSTLLSRRYRVAQVGGKSLSTRAEG